MRELEPRVVTGTVGFLVTGHWCDRCGDTNYDATTRECLTCTYPDDPCSRVYWDGVAQHADGQGA